MITIRKHENSIWKIRHELGNWNMGQASITEVTTNEFSKRFKYDNLVNLDLAIPLSRT